MNPVLAGLRALVSTLAGFGKTPIHPVSFYVGIAAGIGWWATGMTVAGGVAAYGVTALGALAVVKHRAKARAQRAAGGAR